MPEEANQIFYSQDGDEVICPNCGHGDNLIEDDVIKCANCGWKDENPEIEEDND